MPQVLPTSVPLLGVLGHRSQCVGPRFSFFWEKLRTASVSQATLWIDGAGRVGSGTWVALCDLSGGSRKEGRSLRLSGDRTPWRARGCRRRGPESEAGQSHGEVPRQLYAQRPACTPRPARAPRPTRTARPYSPAPAAPRPSGTGFQATGRGPGRRQGSCKSHDFPAYINHSLFFSTGCRLKGAVSSFSPKGRGSLGCL